MSDLPPTAEPHPQLQTNQAFRSADTRCEIFMGDPVVAPDQIQGPIRLWRIGIRQNGTRLRDTTLVQPQPPTPPESSLATSNSILGIGNEGARMENSREQPKTKTAFGAVSSARSK